MRPLVLYRNLRYQTLFDEMERLLELVCLQAERGSGKESGEAQGHPFADAADGGAGYGSFEAASCACAGQLIELAAEYGFEGNLWHCFLALCLAQHENAFSTACEIRGDVGGTLSHLARQDFAVFKELFDRDVARLDRGTAGSGDPAMPQAGGGGAPEANTGGSGAGPAEEANTGGSGAGPAEEANTAGSGAGPAEVANTGGGAGPAEEQAEKEAVLASLWHDLADFHPADDGSRLFNKRIRDRILQLSVALGRAKDVNEFQAAVTQFYREFGVGKYGLNKAFRVEENGHEARMVPIVNVEHVYLDDIVGYQIQKKKLIENTEAFLQGRAANNVLLFGDAGTGKSSCIKAILNEYYGRGLRIIEVYKHQFHALSSILEQVQDRNYKFIVYMDDLSFEESELEYKYLKAIIEGGLGRKPKNVLIYATSNRRHLIREKFSDKRELDDDLHANDTVQEKLSLVARFGVTIYFGSPDKKQFQNIVKVLAERHHVTMPEDVLLAEANKWELQHGGLSGRTAAQFIAYLLGSGEYTAETAGRDQLPE